MANNNFQWKWFSHVHKDIRKKVQYISGLKDIKENKLNLKLLSGVYLLKNIINNKVYIGSSINLKKRLYRHLSNIVNNKHENKRLQNSVNKHGVDKFNIYIIEYVKSKNNLIKKEQFWIDYFMSFDDDYGYNMCSIAGNTTGFTFSHSEEYKKKKSESMLGENNHFYGKKHTQIDKEKISKLAKERLSNKFNHPMYGKNHSEEAKLKISIKNKGKKVSEATKQKIKNFWSENIHPCKGTNHDYWFYYNHPSRVSEIPKQIQGQILKDYDSGLSYSKLSEKYPYGRKKISHFIKKERSYEKFQQKLSHNVWNDTYKWITDKDINDTFRRVAKHIASIELDQKTWEVFYKLLKERKYVPGGRILSNAGIGLGSTSFINCFVSGFRGKHQDSIDSIADELKRQAQILKSEGGYGICIDPLRPRGCHIKGVGVDSPGGIEFLNIWDISSEVITKGSGMKHKKGKVKIRKGAMMVTMSIWHPSIEEFILAKRTEDKLTKFNMSVLITDDFIEACNKNKEWKLEFPDTSYIAYDDEWDGNLQEWKRKGYPAIEHKVYEKANDLFDIILKSTYNHNEPGVLFIDRINEMNNLKYCEYINSTNPCSEQPLPIDGSCNLGSLNLTQYVNSDKTDYDYDKLKQDIPYMLRFQDNVNDLTIFPLESQKEYALLTRRIGIGYMGYGSSLYMMKIPYGSKEALKKTDRLCSFITNELYQQSAFLAKEKGVFPLFDKKYYLQSSFVNQSLSKETIKLIQKYGIRNSHLTTIAPTGNTSILTNNVSGGLEPVLSPSYTRTVICSHYPEGLEKPKNINWAEKIYNGKQIWKFIKEGKDPLIKTIYKNIVYKIDKNRGLTYENKVYDYAVFNNLENFKQDELNNADYIKTVFNLSLKEHINTLKVFGKYIDSSMSKTINFPPDVSYDDFKKVYMQSYNSGVIKGITTYRQGTMSSVISINKSNGELVSVPRRIAPKRPKDLDCDIHKINSQGIEYIVLVGLLEGTLYEIFVTANIDSKIDLKNDKQGIIRKNTKGRYSLIIKNEEIIENISQEFGVNPSTLSRLVSMSLRHGVHLSFIVDQLSKDRNFLGIERAISRVLKKYIKDGENVKTSDKCPECMSGLIYQEGCVTCPNCSWSRCN